MYDCAVIGSGPAGISAALTLKSRNVDFIWFGPPQLSEKICSAEKIRNYPGLPEVSGSDMQKAFAMQISDLNIQITPKTVTGIYPMGEHFGILCNQEAFEAKTVILCTGVEAVRPVPGELEFIGRGVSVCATCDGFLYKRKTIAVVCHSKKLEHEAEFLASLAEKVYLVPYYKKTEIQSENVELIRQPLREIRGQAKAEEVVFDGLSVKIDGVFMLKPSVTPSILLQGLDVTDGHIPVDRLCRTNIDGCFAAGDCTGRPYQYAKAVGEGNVAAHSAIDFLHKK